MEYFRPRLCYKKTAESGLSSARDWYGFKIRVCTKFDYDLFSLGLVGPKG